MNPHDVKFLTKSSFCLRETSCIEIYKLYKCYGAMFIKVTLRATIVKMFFIVSLMLGLHHISKNVD